MICNIRPWKIEDADNFAKTLNNINILKNLRDGIPFPYKFEDAQEYINNILEADSDTILAFAITVDDIAKNGITMDMKMYSILKN